MIVGTGIDIIEIPRIRKVIETWGDRFIYRVFNSEEIEYAQQHDMPYPHYAGRFAAKEAIYKALGDRSLTWKDLTIINDSDGRPSCQLKNNTFKGFIHVSISHSKLYAVASAVIEA
jgi:holo-[acyl-carrier protein] synthase